MPRPSSLIAHSELIAAYFAIPWWWVAAIALLATLAVAVLTIATIVVVTTVAKK